MQLGSNGTRRQKCLRAAALLVVGGVVCLLASVVASGLDYVRWERFGGLFAKTPPWIVAWHLVSLVAVGAGFLLMILSGRVGSKN